MKTFINAFKPLTPERVVVIVLGGTCLVSVAIAIVVAIHAVVTGHFNSHVTL